MKKKTNILIAILKLPFLILMYFFLGCYYFLYGLASPFRIFFKLIGDSIFKIYQKKENKKLHLEDIAPNESVSLIIDEKEEEEEEEEEIIPLKESKLTIFYNSLSFIRKKREKEERERAFLISSLQNDTSRSDKPLTFRYTAIDTDGKKEINTFIAYSKVEVYTYLENEHYRVLKIETSKLIELLYGPTSFNSGKFKNKDLIFWLTQLSTYIKSGIPLTDSMRILSKQMSKDTSKKRVFNSIIYNLTLGESFSSSLEKQGNVFPALLINMIKAAEATGELEETLDDMANYYDEVEITRKQMVSAMSYPSIIMVFSIAVVVFILIYVIPKFEGVYASAGAEINPFTLFVINSSDFLSANISYILLLALIIIIIVMVLYKKIKAFRYMFQKILMKFPLISKIIIYKEMSIFAKTFSSLLKNQVFITESISLLTNITKNEIYKEIMIKTIDNIAKGDKISDSFKNHWAVPDVAYYMIVTGESTGELADMMNRVANYYQNSHKTIINSMKSFIEPAMIIFLAVVVGGIVMAVILPMFELYSKIR
ncbi:MAG: type II secretion system F family protein [Bacilli bacterium]|nr:type II secretion system F family protein [Bacilli bacterium]MDD4795880.1 type II secretion system F family protein [Bacilli bacterium]